MKNVYQSGASATPPALPASPSVGHPSAGNPATGVAATKPGEYWYHMITQEIQNAIIAAGIVPDAADLTQLAQAISAAESEVGDASTTVKGIVELATGPETVAGSDANRAVTPSGLFSVLGLGLQNANGYAAFPFKDASSGVLRSLIIQWGVGTTASSARPNVSVTFPFAFPAACAAFFVIPRDAAISYQGQEHNAPTTTGATGVVGTDTAAYSGVGYNWIAIGY